MSSSSVSMKNIKRAETKRAWLLQVVHLAVNFFDLKHKHAF